METPPKSRRTTPSHWMLFIICVISIILSIILFKSTNTKNIIPPEQINSKLSSVKIDDLINNKAYINIYGSPGAKYSCVALVHLEEAKRLGRVIVNGRLNEIGEAKEEIRDLTYYKLTSFICQPNSLNLDIDPESIIDTDTVSTNSILVTTSPTAPEVKEEFLENKILKVSIETRRDQSVLCTLYNRNLVNYKEVSIINNDYMLFQTSFNLFVPKLTGIHTESNFKSELHVKYSDGIKTPDLLEGVQPSENPIDALFKHKRKVTFFYKGLSHANYTLKCFTTSASYFTDVKQVYPSTILESPVERIVKIDYQSETNTNTNTIKLKQKLLAKFLKHYKAHNNTQNKENYKKLYKLKHVLNATSEFKNTIEKRLLECLNELEDGVLYELVVQHDFDKQVTYFARNLNTLSSSLEHNKSIGTDTDSNDIDKVNKQISLFLESAHFRSILMLAEYNDKLQRSFMGLLDHSLLFRAKMFLYEVKEFINAFILCDENNNNYNFLEQESISKLYYSLEFIMGYFVEYFFNVENSVNVVKLDKLRRFQNKFLKDYKEENGMDDKVKESITEKVRRLNFLGLKEEVLNSIQGNKVEKSVESIKEEKEEDNENDLEKVE